MQAIKQFVLRLFKPFQIWLQKSGEQEALITKSQVSAIKEAINEGDILLSFEYGRPTSKLIKGYYDHAAIVTSKMSVMEAVGDKYKNGINVGGVREVDLDEWLYKKDSVAVIRPVYFDSDNRGKISFLKNKLASARSFFYKGFRYDYQFKTGPEFVYCSELVYLCYQSADELFMDHIPYGIEVLPMAYYEMIHHAPTNNMHFELVLEFRNEN